MMVLASGDAPEEVRKIVLLGEARQLATWIQTDIDQPLDLMLLQEREEALGRFLSESNRVDPHPASLLRTG
jgi:hypothetical protein